MRISTLSLSAILLLGLPGIGLADARPDKSVSTGIRARLGEQCGGEHGVKCGRHLGCRDVNPTTGVGTCKARHRTILRLDEVCGSIVEGTCGPKLFCHYESNPTAGNCRPLRTHGVSCSSVKECSHGLVCGQRATTASYDNDTYCLRKSEVRHQPKKARRDATNTPVVNDPTAGC